MSNFSNFKFFVKKFPLSFYGILFLFAYISWRLVDVDTNHELSTLWQILGFIFLPLIAFLMKLSEFLASSKTGLIHGVFVVSLIIFFLFLVDLFILYLRKCLIPAIRNKNAKFLIPKIWK
jgi:hypothetical protein